MKDKIDPANLLFCDLETGVCEVAETTSERRMNDAVPSFVDLSDAKVVDKSSNNEPGGNADTPAPRLNPEHHESNRTKAE